jgi:ribosomal protein S27E
MVEITKVLTLNITHPGLSDQADGWDPREIHCRSEQIRAWKCDAGHCWSARIATRAKGAMCPYCIGLKVWPGFNDLLSKYPEIAAELADDDASLVHYSSRKFVSWNCPKGHVWEATVFSRTQKNIECRICSNEVALTSFNDLTTTHPDIAQYAFRWNPSKYTATSKKNRMWRCDKFHLWSTSISKRVEGASCPKCPT